jgi:hypothetical protein
LLGLSDAEIAEYLCITPATMWNWDKLHPSFLSARAEGREKADAEVADSLRKRAIGYSHKAVKTTYVDPATLKRKLPNPPLLADAPNLRLRSCLHC